MLQFYTSYEFLTFIWGKIVYINLIHHILQCIDSQNHSLLPHLKTQTNSFIELFTYKAQTIWWAISKLKQTSPIRTYGNFLKLYGWAIVTFCCTNHWMDGSGLQLLNKMMHSNSPRTLQNYLQVIPPPSLKFSCGHTKMYKHSSMSDEEKQNVYRLLNTALAMHLCGRYKEYIK